MTDLEHCTRYSDLKEQIADLRRQIKKILVELKEIEPHVVRVLTTMRLESTDPSVPQILLFPDSMKVAELAIQRRSPSMNYTLLDEIITEYLQSQPVTLQNKDAFMDFLKAQRKDRRNEEEVLKYRNPRIGELPKTTSQDNIADIPAPPVPVQIAERAANYTGLSAAAGAATADDDDDDDEEVEAAIVI